MSGVLSRRIRGPVFGLAVALMAPCAAAWAQPAPTVQRLQEMAATVRSMLEAEQRIVGAGALPAEHAEVTTLLKNAETKIAAGALPEADRLLRQGYDKVTSMVMAQRSGQRLEAHRDNQYHTGGRGDLNGKRLLEMAATVRSMLEAEQRIAGGGALPAEHAEVTALLKDAEAKIAAGALP
ncbi:MAG: hypothetical protein H7840_15230, partial [Alphaproteobacteria bacterium]